MKYRPFSLPLLAVFASALLLLESTGQSLPGSPPAAPSEPGTGQPAPLPADPETTPSAQEAEPQSEGASQTKISARTPQRTTTPQPAERAEKLYSFKFEGSDLDLVMEQYCQWTGQIYLKTDAVKATVTLKANNLTKQECIEVVEAILGMNNVALVPMGDKYVKVVQATAPDLVGQGTKINMDPDQKYGETDKIVTQIIQLENVQIPEVQAAIQHLMHAYGKIQTLERSNSLMITDTEANMVRIRELINFIDQATARIEPRIYKIKFAEATEIASKLNEIVTMAGGTTSPSATSTVRTAPPGVIRATTPRTTTTTPTQASISKTEAGSAPIIVGTVKIMSDERTNIILIFSQKENFEFFDGIIKVLDVEVKPTIIFEVINLEYADAEELSGTLNDLVGAATGSRSSSGGSTAPGSSSQSRTGSQSRTSTGTSRTSTGTSRTNAGSTQNSGNSQMVEPRTDESGATAIENLSRLSENTKILADQRSNSILLMGQESDIAAIKNVIKTLDVMLEQVLIEAAIFEVTLGDELRHGIDWLYQSQDGNKVGAWDGASLITNSVGNVAAGALTYYQNLTGINTEIAINLAASDSNVRLLSTPKIMTTDNTEASLSVGQQRPIVTSTSAYANSSGTQSSTYEYKDIGINLTVTPRINPQRVVVMEILQQADQVGGTVSIDGNDVPIILNRELQAQISVPDMGTVALGGLINTEARDSVTKIPILGDIPFIGRYLFSSATTINEQTELIVLMTPYVLANLDEATQRTEKIYDSIDMNQSDWPNKGWSESPLSTRPKPEDEKESTKQ